MRDDEELCRKCFDHYLVDKLGLRAISWQEGEDPPDYFLTVEGQEFAVEVTTLMGKHEIDKGVVPDMSIRQAFLRLGQEIGKTAIPQGILSGTYSISFMHAFDDFGRIRNQIKTEALNFICSTKDSLETPWHVIVDQGRLRRCAIRKTAASPNKVCYDRGTLSGWGGEVLTEACQLLQEAISEKECQLQDMTLPKVLLLNHRYPLAEPQMYKQCVQNLDSMGSFHTIFIVLNDNEGYVLHTQETSWLR